MSIYTRPTLTVHVIGTKRDVRCKHF